MVITEFELCKKYRSLAEAAPYGGCSERFLRRQIAAGELVSYLVGGRRFVTFAGIDKMMEAHKNRRSRKGRGIRSGAFEAQKGDES